MFLELDPAAELGMTNSLLGPGEFAHEEVGRFTDSTDLPTSARLQ